MIITCFDSVNYFNIPDFFLEMTNRINSISSIDRVQVIIDKKHYDDYLLFKQLNDKSIRNLNKFEFKLWETPEKSYAKYHNRIFEFISQDSKYDDFLMCYNITWFFSHEMLEALTDNHSANKNDFTYFEFIKGADLFLLNKNVFSKWKNCKIDNLVIYPNKNIFEHLIINKDDIKNEILVSEIPLSSLGYKFGPANIKYHCGFTSLNIMNHIKKYLDLNRVKIAEISLNVFFEIQMSFFSQLSVNLTNKFNNKPINGFDGDKVKISETEMDLNSMKDLLNTIEKCRMRTDRHNKFYIDFKGTGDPFLYSKIDDLLDALKNLKKINEKGYEISFYTDGLNLTEKMINKIIDCQIDNVFINLSAVDEKSYSEFWGNNKYKEVIQNINYFSSVKKKIFLNLIPKPNIAVTYILNKQTEKNALEFSKKWMFAETYRRNKTLSFVDEEFYKNHLAVEYCLIMKHNHFQNRLEDLKVTEYAPANRFPCRRLFEGIFINSDGNVCICDQDVNSESIICSMNDLNANIYDAGLKEKLLAEKKKHCEEKYGDFCKNCDQWYIPLI